VSPGKPWNLVFASTGNSWKTVFYCLYEPCVLLFLEIAVNYPLYVKKVMLENAYAPKYSPVSVTGTAYTFSQKIPFWGNHLAQSE